MFGNSDQAKEPAAIVREIKAAEVKVQEPAAIVRDDADNADSKSFDPTAARRARLADIPRVNVAETIAQLQSQLPRAPVDSRPSVVFTG